MKLKSDGNGGHHVSFGPKEWLGLAALSLSTAVVVGTLLMAVIDWKLDAALAVHSVTPHPGTHQRLNSLEDRAP